MGRVLRTTLPTGKGGVVHLFVVYGYQGELRQFCGVRGASSRVVMFPLRHGDLLVMDGQLECAHRTVSGLQGPRVNLTYRWVTRHTASCPPAGVVGCVLTSCVQGLAEPSSRRLGDGGPPFCQSLCFTFW